MKLLQGLASYLLKQSRLNRENFHALADKGELFLSGKDLGNGIELARFKYDAVIQIERYPGDAFEIMALVMGWLSENDNEREFLELADPEINVDLNDRKTADIELVVEFDEPIQLIPDPQGAIRAYDQNWRVDTVPIDVADDLNDMEGSTDGGIG